MLLKIMISSGKPIVYSFYHKYQIRHGSFIFYVLNDEGASSVVVWLSLREKFPNTKFFLVRIFSHSN